MKNTKPTFLLGQFGIKLSIIEIGLGSILHGLHIPMAGLLLSLNQGYVLCRCIKLTSDQRENLWFPYAISNIAAGMKTLSPAGKKFGPMLSLSMQGLLFNLGTIFLGRNLIGTILGISLLSLWTFIQPIVTYYLFFGKHLISAVEYFYQKSLPYHSIHQDDLWILALLFVTGKLVIAVGLAILANYSKQPNIYSPQFQMKINEVFEKQKKMSFRTQKSDSNIWLVSFKDLINPFFLISFVLTTIFLFITLPKNVELVWSIMRPLAFAYLFFYFSRTMILDTILIKFENGRLKNFARTARYSLIKMRKVLKGKAIDFDYR